MSFTDFAKAFDKLDHAKLLIKLRRAGIRGKLLKWVKSYLTNRIQYVQVKGSLSRAISVESSVVQGSHLGPLLFVLFLNDIKQYLDVNVSAYADDLKLVKKITSIEDCLVLQKNLDQLYHYTQKNGSLVTKLRRFY